MSDLLKGLAQLKQVRQAGQTEDLPAAEPTGHAQAPQAEPRTASPGQAAPPQASALSPTAGRREEKTLAGRVPLSLHRDLARLVLEAADELGLRRIYIDEALEAAVRIIVEDPDVRARWLREVQEVRVEKASS